MRANMSRTPEACRSGAFMARNRIVFLLAKRAHRRHITCCLSVANPNPHTLEFFRGRSGPPSMHENLLRQAKVLIVDDEPSNVRLLERILELNGRPAVRGINDPRQTLSTVLEFEPDIVLLDL